MEQCACTVQEAFANSKDELLSEHDLVGVFRGMLSAIEHLHACRVVHRDVKPGNMLLAEGRNLSGNPVVKLCDFGLAAELRRPAAGLTDICGTVPYMTPEMLLQGRPYGFGVDIW